MTEKEIMQSEKYGYMFWLADRNNTGKSIYPISFGWECNSGWHPMIIELIEKLAELDTEKDLKIFQIKEKFAGLRVYLEGGATEEMYNLIDDTEKKSYTVCEICGEAGIVRNDIGWIKTLCDKHYNEIPNEYKKITRRKFEKQDEGVSVIVNAPVFKLKTKG